MPSNKMFNPMDSSKVNTFFSLPANVEVVGNIIDVVDVKSQKGTEGIKLIMLLQTPPFTNIKYELPLWQSDYFLDNLNKIINHSGYKGQWNTANILIGRQLQLKTFEKVNKSTGKTEINVSSTPLTLVQPTQQPQQATQQPQQQPW